MDELCPGIPLKTQIFLQDPGRPDSGASGTRILGQVCGVSFSWKTSTLQFGLSFSWFPFGSSVFRNLPFSISSVPLLEAKGRKMKALSFLSPSVVGPKLLGDICVLAILGRRGYFYF